MIPMGDKQHTVDIIQEALQSGASLDCICQTLEISSRTYFRWMKEMRPDRRKGATKAVPRGLSAEEENAIIQHCCSDAYKDLNPYVIFFLLLRNHTYLGSVRTIYRVLKRWELLHHRGKSRPRTKLKKPEELRATGPDQVYSWDITYIHTPVRGLYFYAYLVMDIWTRKIMGWEIHEKESEHIASAMFKRISTERNLHGVCLHSDNGTPMKGSTMLMTLYSLGVLPSFSRPRVSDDNPFSESLFKTLKYMPGYPGKFDTLQDARAWMALFVDWYNQKHLHSGIGYITPEERASGQEQEILNQRNTMLLDAYKKNPQRWSKPPKQWTINPVVTLNKKGKRVDAGF